ncbi:MAG TPA: hypothetical protein VKY73_16290 [Polyangiaceae bacterium]|nr:hypothetical protein [Polyangiaceae bacterium]
MSRLGIRWTIGDVSDQGFEALQCSIWGAWNAFGPDTAYAVCVNTVSLDRARSLTGVVPEAVRWHWVARDLPAFLIDHVDAAMAEGVAWKLAPVRMYPDRYELSLDNDCILWDVPEAIRAWLAHGEGCVLAEDVRRCFGKFSALCGPRPMNLGIRGIPPGLDLGDALATLLREHPCVLESELDEQGLQVAAVSRVPPLFVIPIDEVTICSPFPPHLPHLGRRGAHFVGLNSKALPWSYEGRPATELTREHWARLRPEVARRVRLPTQK